MSFNPNLPVSGQYTDGHCHVSIDESWPQVTFREQGHEFESLQDAMDRLDRISDDNGILNIRWNVEIPVCDRLRTRRNHQMRNALVIRGVLGPNGERPWLYCRSEKRDGNVPHSLVGGKPFFAWANNLTVFENLHIDGYRSSLGFSRETARVVLRNNLLHHAFGNGIQFNGPLPGKVQRVEECGNYFSHSGQDNAKHTHYTGSGREKKLKQPFAPPLPIKEFFAGIPRESMDFDGGKGKVEFIFVDNIAHDGAYSSLLKANAEESIIKNNTFYDVFPVEGWLPRPSGMMLDIPSCTNSLIEGNTFIGKGGRGHSDQIGIRHKRTHMHGCNQPSPFSREFWSEAYWAELKAQGNPKLFIQAVRNNIFYANPDTVSADTHKQWPIHIYGGTWPIYDIYGGFRRPILLPVPIWLNDDGSVRNSWYERHKVVVSGNRYIGFNSTNEKGVNGGHLYKISLYDSQPEKPRNSEIEPPMLPNTVRQLMDYDLLEIGPGETVIPGSKPPSGQ